MGRWCRLGGPKHSPLNGSPCVWKSKCDALIAPGRSRKKSNEVTGELMYRREKICLLNMSACQGHHCACFGKNPPPPKKKKEKCFIVICVIWNSMSPWDLSLGLHRPQRWGSAPPVCSSLPSSTSPSWSSCSPCWPWWASPCASPVFCPPARAWCPSRAGRGGPVRSDCWPPSWWSSLSALRRSTSGSCWFTSGSKSEGRG